MTPLAYVRGLNPHLPRSVHVLQLGSLVNAFGNGLVLPFLFIYLTDVRRIDKATAGLVLGLEPLVALAVSAPAGALAARVGARATLMVALVTASIGFGAFAFATTPWEAFAAAAVAGCGTGAFWPAQSSLIAQLTPRDRSHTAWSMQRVMANAGIGLGGLTAGFLAHGSGVRGYEAIFLLDAVTFLVYLAIAATLPDVRAARGHGDSGGGSYRAVLRSRVLVSLYALNALWVAAGLSLLELLPAYVKHEAAVSPRQIGLMFLANTVFISVMQLPVTQRLEGTRRIPTFAAVLVIGGLCWMCVPLLARSFDGSSATLVFAGLAILFGVAECLHGAVQAPLVVDLSEPRLLERTMALSSGSWMLGFVVGPAIGGVVLKVAPSALWIGAGGILLVSAAAALRIEEHVPHAVRRTPQRQHALDELGATETLGG